MEDKEKSRFLKIIDDHLDKQHTTIVNLTKSIKERDFVIIELAKCYLESKKCVCYRRPKLQDDPRRRLYYCDECPLNDLAKELVVDLDLLCIEYKNWSK